MRMNILGVAETFWDGNGEFSTNIPGTKDSFRVLYSGGDKKRRGVGVILRGMIGKALMHYETISDRIRLTSKSKVFWRLLVRRLPGS